MLTYDRKLKELSRDLRGKPTEAEQCLWTRLRLKHLGYAFYRQKPIGEYIVDFFCPKARLVVEVDGGRHFTAESSSYDRIRDEYMQGLGLTVLRFSNSEALQSTDAVAERIYEFLQKIPLNPPLRKGDKRTRCK